MPRYSRVVLNYRVTTSYVDLGSTAVRGVHLLALWTLERSDQVRSPMGIHNFMAVCW